MDLAILTWYFPNRTSLRAAWNLPLSSSSLIFLSIVDCKNVMSASVNRFHWSLRLRLFVKLSRLLGVTSYRKSSFTVGTARSTQGRKNNGPHAACWLIESLHSAPEKLTILHSWLNLAQRPKGRLVVLGRSAFKLDCVILLFATTYLVSCARSICTPW